MFIYVIDTTLMNVSISALVEDLDTTVGAVQAAITLYTLTMAAFMLTGGKLGDIWGSKRAFRIGLVIYGIGTTITAFAPSIVFIIIGWSILEGLGSALLVPAINTLVRANYGGSQRASAYLWIRQEILPGVGDRHIHQPKPLRGLPGSGAATRARTVCREPHVRTQT